MDLSDVIARVKERLDEESSVSLRYTTANISEYVTDGIRFYVAKTGCQVTTTTITQEPATHLYYLPCDCIQVQRVLWQGTDGKQYSLEPTLTRELDAQWHQWQRQTDTRARAYYLFGLDRIGLWPLSDDANEYVIHYRQDLFDSVSRVPVEDHECLVDYAVARCLLPEGKLDAVTEYKRYADVVEAAKRRMANADRVWSQGRAY